jgi:hypothetical protein
MADPRPELVDHEIEHAGDVRKLIDEAASA